MTTAAARTASRPLAGETTAQALHLQHSNSHGPLKRRCSPRRARSFWTFSTALSKRDSRGARIHGRKGHGRKGDILL